MQQYGQKKTFAIGGMQRGYAYQRTKKVRVLQLGIECDSDDVPVVHEYRQTPSPIAKPKETVTSMRYEPVRRHFAYAADTKIKTSLSRRAPVSKREPVEIAPAALARAISESAMPRILDRNICVRKENVLEELQKSRIARALAVAQFKKPILAEKLETDNDDISEESVRQIDTNEEKQREELFLRSSKQIFSLRNLANLDFSLKSPAFSFVTASLVLLCLVGSVVFVKKGVGIQSKVLGVSSEAYADLTSAVDSVSQQDFEVSVAQFGDAYEKFSQACSDIDDLGAITVATSRFIPFASKLSSGKYSMEAAKHISKAGQELNVVAKNISAIKNPITDGQQESNSFLEILALIQKHGSVARSELVQAQNDLEKVNADDLPGDKRDKFSQLKEKIPVLIGMLDVFIDNSNIMADLFGANGPRKYMFLFQNNNEMRATGGFIGSYGLLDISQGRVRNFFIDGIFNPDGQLIEKIVPPKPIQKMSAAWSLHDSNWWPDFPTSAKEAIKFYEKTGGPTVDGVITFTPTVMQKLLEITGPIEMPEYDVTLDADNFVEKTQYEVEVDYDKEENKPKKILSDLAPIVLDKLLAAKDIKTVSGVAKVFSEALSQKHILIYSENDELEKIISTQGWSGEMHAASRDYISVINTNINGYKTDGVVREKIEHSAEIQDDGSVIDTVIITRKHEGGNTEYEWKNKVNADYMRVYVPKGSELLEVSGQTREFTEPPLDYDALGFKRDPLVEKEENSMSIDENTGTRTYEESGKTVFANWTYVSPQETVVVTYKYRLPFKLFQVATSNKNSQADAYSLVAQKQAGSIGSQFVSHVSYPNNFDLKWQNADGASRDGNALKNGTLLDTDRFWGYVFEKK